MRPISLKIEAFGSYGKETLIDFTKPTQNLFLITGDTGSGKSTIFDAMVFALYGKGKVSDLEYQSNFAGFDKQPCVTFKFADSTAENAKQYTIIRTPQYSTYKKRGNKNELKNKSATITLIEDGSDNSWDSKNGAEDKIIDIVGLDRSQFMQVAMIAQGEFMTVIREKTENKKKIFRKIFNTGIYEKIADVFKSRKKDLENKTDIIKTECQTELLHTVLYDKYDRCLDLQEQLELIKNGKMFAIDDFLVIFDEYCTYLEKEYENICNNNAEITKKYDDANAEQTKAEQLLNAFAEYDKAVEILAQCDSKKTKMTEKEDLLKKINDCYAINPYYKNYIKAQNEQNSLENKISIQEKELPDLEKKADIAESQVKETEPLLEKAKTDLAKIENSVKTALEIFAKKEEISKELAKIKVEYTEKINLKTNKEKEIESINNLLKENNEIREKYKNAGVEKVQLDNEIKECKTLVEKNQNIEDIQNHIKELQQKCAEKQAEFKKYKEKYTLHF